MSRTFFSLSEHRRRDYEPSGAPVKDILPLLRTTRVGERRASATSSLRPGPRVEAGAAALTGQRLDQRSEIVAGSMQKDRPHRGALSRHHR